MLLKLTTILLVLARLAPEALALPVNSTLCGYERFECISDTSFWNGAEMQCPQGTHCEDVGDADESPCVNDLPVGACPPLDEEEEEDEEEEDVEPEPSMSILPVLEPSASLQIVNAWANYGRPGTHSVRPQVQPTQTQQDTQPQVVAPAPAAATPVVTSIVPAPVQTTVQPQPVQATTSSVVPAAPAPAGDIYGTTEFTAGSATFQLPVDALGACGLTIGNPTQYHVALAHAKWDSYGGDPNNGNSSPLCTQKKTVTVTYKSRTIPNVPILDKCMGCSGDDLDMSRQLFIDLFQDLGGDIEGYGRIPGDHPEFGHATWRFDP